MKMLKKYNNMKDLRKPNNFSNRNTCMDGNKRSSKYHY